MPFEQKYTPETRDASLARIVERRLAEPGNRAIIRETAEEFQVGEQSLRGWIRVYEKANAPVEEVPAVAAASVAAPAGAPVAAAPAVSAPVAESPAPAVAPTEHPASSSNSPRRPGRPSNASLLDDRVAELELEVAKLRRDREALKSALAVLLDD